MKNSLKTLAIAAVALGLTACAGIETEDDTFAVPYTLERTAVGEERTAARVEPAALPQCPVCPAATPAPAPQCDFSAWESRVAALEAELKSCKESSSRVRDAYRDELTK